MSYSKFHYVESACAEFDSSLVRDRFTVQEFALCYLALTCKKAGLDFSKSVSSLLEEINKKESI